MSGRHWFIPRSIDLLGMLRAQAAITVDGMEALSAWAGGQEGAAERLRECEHRADARKRQLRQALTETFTTPLEPEDIFDLSRGLDGVLNRAKNTVREADVMRADPDAAIAEMAGELLQGTQSLALAFDSLGAGEHAAATEAADRAVKSQRRLERIYRNAMSALVDVREVQEVTAKRELYRRLVRASDHLAEVAERVWYAVLKVS